jgi:putative ABC transport system permease protein
MDALLWDIRQAFRLALNAPGFALAAILTLAFGVGANVAMFSIVYGVLLRPLPYQDADRLVVVRAEADYAGTHRAVPVFVQPGELKTWARPFDSIASTAFYTPNDIVALSGDNGSEVLDSSVVSGAFFSTVQGPFAAGRPLSVDDDAAPVVVISERLAERLFGSATAAIGRQLTLTKNAYTVIGVASRGFQFPSANTDAWLPAGHQHAVNPRCCAFRLIARLDATGNTERARAAMQPMFDKSIGSQGAVRRGATGSASAGSSAGSGAAVRSASQSGVRTSVTRLSDDLVAAVRPALLVLFASVLLVLIIACGNLINLLLARHVARAPEFAVRRALGASAGRLVRQLLVESAFLATAGVALGVIIAGLSLTAVSQLGSRVLPRLDAIQIDRTALLFAAGLGLLTTILTGLAPALRAMRGSADPSLGSIGKSTPPGARRLQRAMCIVQVSLAVMLLTGATLMGRSLVRLLHVDLGVQTDHVLTASLDLAFGESPTDAQTIAGIDRAIEQIRALPGIRAVGFGTSVPPNVSRLRITLRRAGDAVDYQATAVPATPGYFSALRMRLLKGRFFTDTDDNDHAQVMIMSEDTARRFFGTEDAIGRTMMLPVFRNGTNESAEMTLVGVTANVKYGGLTAPPDDVVYRPFAQQPWIAPFLVVRTTGDPAEFSQIVRRAIAAVDKTAVVSNVTTLDQRLQDATAQPQFRTMLLAAFAAFAMGIAAIGLYGVVAYAVSRRSREIGIRIALGATSQSVLTMMLREGALMAATGIAIGSGAALILTQLLSGLLYGVTPTDPTSFVLSATGLLALTLVASYLPARRAARIDPITALRTE